MIHCGVEEPIQSNASLFLKAGGEEIITDNSTGLSLNRYSFVEKEKGGQALFPLVEELINQLDMTANGIASWLSQLPERSKLASRIIEKNFINKGWEVILRKNHYLAIKKLHPEKNNFHSLPIFGANSFNGGFFIILSRNIIPRVHDKIGSDLCQFLARTWYFVPSKKLLKTLEKEDLAIIYQVNDELGNKGLVLVTTRLININDMEKVVTIKKVFTGNNAYKIFI